MSIFSVLSKDSIMDNMSHLFNTKESILNIVKYDNEENVSNPFIFFVDLALGFNIPQNKLYIKNEFVKELKQCLNINFYLSPIYKNSITKKIIVDSDENSYNAIISYITEIDYLIKNLLYDNNNILIVNLGRFIEYRYIFRLLNGYYNQNNNLINMYNNHYSYFLDNPNLKKNKNFLKDIGKIKKKLIDISIVE